MINKRALLFSSIISAATACDGCCSQTVKTIDPDVETVDDDITGEAYRGEQNVTEDGYTCMYWDDDTYTHNDAQRNNYLNLTPEEVAAKGLSRNYCRNPDGNAKMWCYTTEMDVTADEHAGPSWQTCDPKLYNKYEFNANILGGSSQYVLNTSFAPLKPLSDFSNSDPTNCPMTMSLVKNDGSALDGGLELIYQLDGNGYLVFYESIEGVFEYDGSDIQEVQVKVTTDYGQPLYKPVNVKNGCPDLESVLEDTDAYAEVGVKRTQNSGYKEITMSNFFKTDGTERLCYMKNGYMYTLTDDNQLDSPSSQNGLLNISNPFNYLAQAKLQIDEESYTGGDDITFYVRYYDWKRFTGSDPQLPLFYQITLKDLCKDQVLTFTGGFFEVLATRSTALDGEDEALTALSEDLDDTQSANNCVDLEWSYKNTDGSELGQYQEGIMAISSAGKASVRSGYYIGGTIDDVKLHVYGEYAPEVSKQVKVTETCGQQTIGEYDAAVEICNDPDCQDYRGVMARTRTGVECTPWMEGLWNPSQVPFNPVTNTGMGLDRNYCRNPGGDKEGLWCPTVGSLGADGDFGMCDPMAATGSLDFEIGYDRDDGDLSYKSTTSLYDDFINTNPTVCPVSFGLDTANGDSIEGPNSNGNDIDGNSKSGAVADWINIDSDGYINISEGNYKGGDFDLRVYAMTDFDEKTYKSLTIKEICIKQTVTTGADTSYTVEAVEMSTGAAKQALNFENSNRFACPITYSLEDTDRNPISADLQKWMGFTDDDEFYIDQSMFPGGEANEVSVLVKAITPWNMPVYKTITVKEVCGKQSVAPKQNDLEYEIEAGKDAPSPELVLSTNKIVDDFVNLNPYACPATYSIVDGFYEPISGAVAAYVSINADGYLQIDENAYPGGNLDLILQFDNTYSTPGNINIKLTEKCVAFTYSLRNANSWEFDVVETFTATHTSETTVGEEYTNSNPTACPITYSLVASDYITDITEAVASYIKINDDGNVEINGDNFPGGDVTLNVKAITDFNDGNAPVYRPIEITEVCGKNTVTFDSADIYEIEGGKDSTDPKIIKSLTKPADDFTNTNPTACPTTISLVDQDGMALSADVAAFVSITEDGYITLNEATYTGGNYNLAVNVVNAWSEGDPVRQNIALTEKCVASTVTVGSADAIVFEAIEMFTNEHKSETVMSDYFATSNPTACPITYTIVDAEGAELTAEVAAYISINDDLEVVLIESAYPGGPEVNLQVKANSDFNDPKFKPITITEVCGKDTLTPSGEYIMKAVKESTLTILSDTTPLEDFVNSNSFACGPAVFKLQDSDKNDISAEVAAWISINSDGFISIDESAYPGGVDLALYVQAVNTWAGSDSSYKAITVKEFCGVQTVTVNSPDAYEFTPVETFTGTLKSATKPADDFTTTNTRVCPMTFTLVDSEGADLSPEVAAYATINDEGEVQILESAYPGGNVSLQVKAISDFGEAVYKPITLTEKCGKQTLADIAETYTLSAVETHTGRIKSLTTPLADFVNSNAFACPVTFSLVDTFGDPISGVIAGYMSINSDGEVEVDEANYPGGADVSIQVQAITDFDAPVYAPVTITEVCTGKQTLTTSGSYDLEAVETFTGKIVSLTKPEDDFVNSNAFACPVTYSIVTSSGNPLPNPEASFISINAEGLVEVDEANYPGAKVFNLKVKAITDFGTPVYKPITVTEICTGKQTLADIEEAYVLEAVETFTGRIRSLTTPLADFVNSNAYACPVTFSLVDTDGAPIEGVIATYMSINANGEVEVNEANYPGGADVSIQVKAITDFNTPVYKPITITEICTGKQTLSVEGAYLIEAVETYTGTRLSKTKPSVDFVNSNAFACDVRYSIVDTEGVPITDDIAAYVSINEDGDIAVDEASYPGGVDVSLQIRAITDYGTPVFKPLTISEICGKQTLYDLDTVYPFVAVREFTGTRLSLTAPFDDIKNSNAFACPITFSLVDNAGEPIADDIASFVSINEDGHIQVDEATYPGGEVVRIQVKSITPNTENVEPFYQRITITEICGRQSHTVTDIEKVYDLKAISEKPGKILSTTKPSDDITNNDPSVCPTTWTLVETNGDALTEEHANILSIDEDGFLSVDQMNFEGVNFSAQVKAINLIHMEPVFSPITITRQWLCRERTRTVSGGDFHFDPEMLISDSACSESCTTQWTTCSANNNQSCFELNEKVTNQGDWDSTYKCALTDDESFDNFLVAFTSNIANMQLTLNVLPEANQATHIACMKQVAQPTTLTDPSFAEQQSNLENVVNGYYACLTTEALFTDPYLEEELRLYAPEDGFCGPAHGAQKDEYGEWVENTQFLDCIYPLCCGFAVPKGSSDDIRISTCADQYIYTPERVLGYERTIGTEEWDFSCQNAEGARILFLALNAIMITMSVSMI